MKSISKADLLDLINWLKTKPTKGKYNYQDTRNCLLAQYLTERGFSDVRVTHTNFNVGGTLRTQGYSRLPNELIPIAEGMPHTYGDALRRAEAYQLVAIVKDTAYGVDDFNGTNGNEPDGGSSSDDPMSGIR